MRRLTHAITLSFIVLITVTLPVRGQNPETKTEDQSGSQALLAVLYDQLEAFNTADVDRLVNNVSPDFKYFYIQADSLMLEVAGQEAFKRSMTAYFGYVRELRSVIDGVGISGNRVSFRETVSYTNPSGKRMSASAIAVYQIDDAKIKRAWYFID